MAAVMVGGEEVLDMLSGWCRGSGGLGQAVQWIPDRVQRTSR